MIDLSEAKKFNPEELTNIKKEALADIIDELPENERLVIALCYCEGLTFKEIAEILQVAESGISQIHSRVLGEVRVKLEK